MYKDLFTFPFTSGPMVANLTFATLFTLCFIGMRIAGYFGMAVVPLVIILIMLYGHYCVDIALAAGKGIADKTVFQFAGFSPQILFFFMCQIALYVFLVMYAGFWIAATVISFIMPASIATMAVEKNFLQALNPLAIISYAKRYKTSILIPMLGIWLLVASIVWLPQDLWLIVRLFISLTLLLWLFYAVGLILLTDVIQRHENLSETNARVFVEDKAPPETSFVRLTDEWHRFNEVREMTKALESIARFVRTQTNQQEAAEQVMKEISGWRNTRLAYRFLPDYLNHMAESRKYGLMYQYYRRLCLDHGAISVRNPEVRENLYQFALTMDDDQFVEKLAD